MSYSISEQLVRQSVVPMPCTIAEMRVRSRKLAAFQSPRLNVELNAAGITDQTLAQAAREQLALAGPAEDLDLVVRSTYRLVPCRTS